ncbi:peptide-methionine (R)-S-oxide reductase, partial [Arcobacter cryaerophilus gv. occultus]
MSNNNPEQWRNKLSSEQFRVCWEKGTEQPYSGALLHNRKSGDYLCVCCKSMLFHSDAKFDSGCGWPSFDRAIEGTVTYTEDSSHG